MQVDVKFVELGEQNNIDAVQTYVSLAAKRVVEIGCGGFGFTTLMVDAGAKVVAVDPDPIQASKNRAGLPIEGIEFHECGADTLPVESDSCDGALLAYSLHHVPKSVYPAMFKEIFRALRPGGFLVVIEPTHCTLDNVMRLFHNEDKVREDAQQAILSEASPRFDRHAFATYYSTTRYESFDQFVDHFASRSFNSIYDRSDIENDRVKRAFDENGGDGHEFEARKKLFVLEGFNS